MTTEPTMITMSSDSVARLVEVLEHCDEFLRTTRRWSAPSWPTSASNGPTSPPAG